MIKYLVSLAVLISCTAATLKEKDMHTTVTAETVYGFKLPSIEGGVIDFSAYKGKKILIVNTASECGYTPQYEGLEKIYEQYKDKLVVVGVPSNDFGKQEPGSDEEIHQFCKVRYGVTFPLTTKVDVVGENADPLFKWLTHKDQNGVLDAEVKWNFTKFLIDENGKLIAAFPSKITPESEEIVKYLK